MRLIEAQKNLDNNLKDAVKDLETKTVESLEREKISKEINELKEKAKQIRNSTSSPKEIEEINNQIEKLLEKIQSL